MAESRLNLVIDAQDNASKALKGLSGNIQKMQPAFRKMALYGTAAFAAIGAGIFKTTQMAVDAQETFNKFDVVFQDVSKSAEKAANDLSDNWGLAGSSAKKLLSDTGDLLTGLGVAGDVALDLSTKTQKLAIDLASFTNIEGGAQRASRSLTKALLGERESVKELGIVILESDVKLRLAEQGMDNLTGTALKAARASVTLDLAMEQSKNALGDFARTSDQVANQQRVLKERVKDMSETIGAIFIPIMAMVVKKLLPVIKNIGKWIKENPKLAKVIIIATIVLTGLVAVIGFLGLAIPPLIVAFTAIKVAVAGFTFNPIVLAIVAVIVIIALLVSLVVRNWDTIKSTFINATNAIASFFSAAWITIKNTFKANWDKMVNILDFALAFIQGLLIAFMDTFFPQWRDRWTELIEKFTVLWNVITSTVQANLTKIKTFWSNVLKGIQDSWAAFSAPFKTGWDLLWKSASDSFLSIWEGIKESFKSAVNWIIEKINFLITAINRLIAGINKVATMGGRLGGGIPEIPTIPALAKGGIVNKPTLAMLGEAGPEAVIPLNKGGGAGIGMNVTLNIGTIIGAGMDMDELSEMIGDTLVGKLTTNMRV